mgnify:CR=1 FL=1
MFQPYCERCAGGKIRRALRSAVARPGRQYLLLVSPRSISRAGPSWENGICVASSVTTQVMSELGRFDVALLCSVLEHLPDHIQAIRERSVAGQYRHHHGSTCRLG